MDPPGSGATAGRASGQLRLLVSAYCYCPVTEDHLLGVVGDQSLVITLEDADLGDDLFGFRSPGERLCVGVPVGDVGIDGVDEDAQRSKASAADGLPGGLCKSSKEE